MDGSLFIIFPADRDLGGVIDIIQRLQSSRKTLTTGWVAAQVQLSR